MLRVLGGFAFVAILLTASIVGIPLPSAPKPQTSVPECELLAAYFDRPEPVGRIFDAPELVDSVPALDDAEGDEPPTVVLTRFATRGPGPGDNRTDKTLLLSASLDESRRGRGRLDCNWSGFPGVRAVDPFTAIETFGGHRRWRPANWFALTRAQVLVSQLSVSRRGLRSPYTMIEINDFCIGWCGGRGWAVFEKRDGEWVYKAYILDRVA